MNSQIYHCRICDVDYVMRPIRFSGELFPHYQPICPVCTGYFDTLFDDPGEYEVKEVEHIGYLPLPAGERAGVRE
jgi:hypothetical protein